MLEIAKKCLFWRRLPGQFSRDIRDVLVGFLTLQGSNRLVETLSPKMFLYIIEAFDKSFVRV